MNRPSRIASLVHEAVERGEAGVEPQEALLAGRLQVLSGSDVDWADALNPRVCRGDVASFSSSEFWSRVSHGNPTWISMAWYTWDGQHGCLIIEHNSVANRSVWADPTLAISRAPEDACLVEWESSDGS